MPGKEVTFPESLFLLKFCCSDCKTQYYRNRPIRKVIRQVIIVGLIIGFGAYYLYDNQKNATTGDNKSQVAHASVQPDRHTAISPPEEHSNTHIVEQKDDPPTPQPDNEVPRVDARLPEPGARNQTDSISKNQNISTQAPPANSEQVASGADSVQLKKAELKGQLASVNARIDEEKTKWKVNIDTINRLTNHKRTPVQEGSAAYYECLKASQRIREVESGAPALKEAKARLEATISELEQLNRQPEKSHE